MMTREELEAISLYGPSGSKQAAREVVDSHLALLSRVERIERLCLATKKDTGEAGVRIFATDILKVIDPAKDWDQAVYG